MLYGRFIQSKQVDQAAPFHDPLKTLKFKTLAPDCLIKKYVKTIPLLIYYVKLYKKNYVTSFNKHSNLRNFVNHLSERVSFALCSFCISLLYLLW